MKKYNTKFAKKDATKGSRKGISRRKRQEGQKAKQVAQTMSAEQLLIAEANDPNHPEAAQAFEAVLGIIRPVSQALTSDLPLVESCSKNVKASLVRDFKAADGEYGAQVTRIGLAPIANVRLDIAKGRKAAALYSKAEVNAIAGLRMSPVADPELGVCMALDLIAIVWGPDARLKLEASARRSRKASTYQRSTIIWYPAKDRKPLKDTLRATFRPPWHRPPESDPFYDQDAVFDDAWGPNKRALITLMCRSQLPLRNMLVGFGAGKPIVSGAIMSVEHVLKERCRVDPEVVHRDEIAHRWFNELRRRGLDDISVPVLLLH